MAANLLLLDPPHKVFGALRLWMPSPGLMARTAYLEENGIPVDLLDATTLSQPWTELETLLKKKRYDLVGITCTAATFHQDAVCAARLVRQCLPDALIIGGGGHFTLNAEQILIDAPQIDVMVLGEAEETLTELYRWAESGKSGTD